MEQWMVAVGVIAAFGGAVGGYIIGTAERESVFAGDTEYPDDDESDAPPRTTTSMKAGMPRLFGADDTLENRARVSGV